MAQQTLRAIMLNFTLETQQQTLWKSVENLVDLHAAEMVQIPRYARNDKIFLSSLL
jgi:hypothetical protein